MQFLVTGEWVEVGALLPPAQMVPIMDGLVLPSLEMFAQWEREGRIRGGILAGQRAGAFVLEAASAEEPVTCYPACRSGDWSSGTSRRCSPSRPP